MAEVILPIRAFKGLNIREPAPVIDDHELSECINFDLGRAGELTRRTGWEKLHGGLTLGSNQVSIIGHFRTPTFSQLIARAGSSVYYSADGITWAIMTANGTMDVEWGCQYGDKFYMVRKTGTILEWAGSGTPTAITGTPSGTFCIIHKDRMFVINTNGSGNVASTIYFSLAGPANIPVQAGWVSTNNFLIQPGDGDWLIALAIVNDVLVMFKGSTTWGLYVQGSSSVDWIIRNLSPRIGCISKYTPREIEGAIYFVSSTGIYKTDGTSFVDISEAIAPILRGRVLTLTNLNVDSAAWWEDKYIVLLQPDPATAVYYVFHLRAGGWTEWEFSGSVQPFAFIEVRSATPTPGVYAGDRGSTGRTFRYGTNVFADDGVAYTSTLETKEYDFDALTNYKRGKWLAFDTIGAATFTVTNVVDGTDATPETITSQTTRKALKAKGPGYFRAWKLRVATAGGAFSFYGGALFLHRKKALVKAAT
jgi:hypothetical protein